MIAENDKKGMRLDDIIGENFCGIYDLKPEEILTKMFSAPAGDFITDDYGKPDCEYIKVMLDSAVELPSELMNEVTFGEYLVCMNHATGVLAEEDVVEEYPDHDELQSSCMFKVFIENLAWGKGTHNRDMLMDLPYKTVIDCAVKSIAEKEKSATNPKALSAYKSLEKILSDIKFIETSKSSDTSVDEIGNNTDFRTVVRDYRTVMRRSWVPGQRLDKYRIDIMKAYSDFYYKVFMPLVMINTCKSSHDLILDKYVGLRRS